MIEMTAIRKAYSTGKMEVVALRSVDLTIGSNEYVAIVGPSGSGKSTLMNLIGCLDTPTSGTYMLSGQNVAGLDRNQHRLARSAQGRQMSQGNGHDDGAKGGRGPQPA